MKKRQGARTTAKGGRRFKAYPAYRDSGVEWLGEVPAHWTAKRLKFLAPASIGELNIKPDGAVYVGLEHVQSWTGRLLLENQPERVDSVVASFNAGDVLFGKLRPYLAKAARPDFDGVCTSEILPFRPGAECTQSFAMYCLLNAPYIRWLDSLTYGTKMPRISPEQIGSSFMPVPPVSEQFAIAAFLDRETARIDALVAKKERLIELLQEERTALITRAVTKGLNPTARMKDSSVEWLGDVPEHWEVVPVRRMARAGYRTFVDGDWIESPYIQDDGIRLIQTGNVGIGRFKEQGFRYISDVTFTQLRCTEVLPGDLLICRLDGPVGRACLAPDLGVRMITSVDNTILKLDHRRCDPRFVVYFLSSQAWLGWVESICRVGGGFRLRVSRSMLGGFPLLSPPVEEQQRIADILDSESRRVDRLLGHVHEAIDRLLEFRTALISAAVTGKIDVREQAA